MKKTDWLKFEPLKPGDTVALLSMSWGGPSVFPHIYESGKKYLEDQLGLKTKEYWSTRASAREIAKNPQRRAEDLMAAFQDAEVEAIFATIGGDDCMLVLPYLDFDIIRSNPKMVIGFSDTAAILNALAANRMMSFHGPSIMAGFAQAHSLPSEWHDHVRRMLFGEVEKGYGFPEFKQFSDRYLDWKDTALAPAVKEWLPTGGWRWLNGDKKVTGRLLGGCIEVLEFLKGTLYWPKGGVWKNAILLLETSEEKPSITRVKRMLRNYGLQGILQNLSAVLIGRARDYSDDEKKALDEAVKSVILDEFGCGHVVIVSNVDAGHTEPQLILPIGAKLSINPKKKTLSLAEDIFVRESSHFAR